MTSLTLYDDKGPSAVVEHTDDRATIAERLAAVGIGLERWDAAVALADDASDAAILAAYAAPIERLKAERGYQAVDVIRVQPDHPERGAMRAKFLAEHVHDEDEVRFFVEGSGMFYIHAGGRVHALECTLGDLISLPTGTRHWFDMGEFPASPRYGCSPARRLGSALHRRSHCRSGAALRRRTLIRWQPLEGVGRRRS